MAREFARYVGIAASLFADVACVRELLTRENRDILVDSIGSVVSLHSVYYGLVVAFSFLLAVLSIPIIKWMIRIPERHRENKRAQRDGERKRILGILKQIQMHSGLQYMLNRHDAGHVESSNYAELMKEELTKIGLGIPDHAGGDWTAHVAMLIPYVDMHGIERARSELKSREREIQSVI